MNDLPEGSPGIFKRVSLQQHVMIRPLWLRNQSAKPALIPRRDPSILQHNPYLSRLSDSPPKCSFGLEDFLFKWLLVLATGWGALKRPSISGGIRSRSTYYAPSYVIALSSSCYTLPVTAVQVVSRGCFVWLVSIFLF